jgi:hypothetical protein
MRCKYIVRPAGRQWEVYNVTHAKVIDTYRDKAQADKRMMDLLSVQRGTR